MRHGATDANEQRPFVLQGCEIDGSLTESGRKQAAALTRFLSNVQFGAVYASPMRRALETVRDIAAARSLPVTTIEALRECRVGRWAGLSWDQIHQREPELAEKFLADPASQQHPDGESFEELHARVAPVLSDLMNRHLGENVIVLAHNLVNRVVIAHLLGMDLRHARRIRQTNCCINILQHSSETTEVVTVNSVWHLHPE